MSKTYYVLIVLGDIEPELRGPYRDAEDRDLAAKQHRKRDVSENDGIFWLDVGEHGKPEVGSYSGGFFDEESESAAGG